MASPIVTTILQNVVTKVATNAIEFLAHNLSQGVVFYYTFRDTGSAAPSIADISQERIPLFSGNYNYKKICFETPVDIYVYAPSENGIILTTTNINSNIPFTYDIATKHTPNKIPWAKIGTTPATLTTEALLWNPGTAYVFPTAAMQMEVVSSSANDDAGNTGIQKVRIYYLDNTYAERQEVVTLDGVTAVATVATNILRINDFKAEEVGTAGKAIGAVSIRNLDHSTIYDQIPVGGNASKSIVYTVPLGKTLWVSSLLFSAGANAPNKRVTFTTKGTWDHKQAKTTVGRFLLPYTEITVMDSVVNIPLEIPTELPATTDVLILTKGEAGAIASCTARG